MAVDWGVGRPTWQCAATGRVLAEGEDAYAVLREKDDRLVREEYGLDAWPEVDKRAFVSYWRTRRPAADEAGRRKITVDLDAFYAFFVNLEDAVEPERVLFRGVAALVLARKRALRLDGVGRDASGREVLRLFDRRAGKAVEVPAPRAGEAEIRRIEEELQGLFLGEDGKTAGA